ncbi:isopropylmalate synthase [Solibacillus isronensis]|uniref:isopropylmalate synthase n=1 Tax=Solibacillus isronensis TaxID=412383 RepID=UPI0020CA4489|nr:isopropylmalate synthase [Solibacillus isronensis]
MKTIQMLQWLDNLKGMNDRQLQDFAKQQGLELSIEEVQKLQKILKHANISWALTGVPKEVLQKIHKLLGDKRYKKLMKLVGL